MATLIRSTTPRWAMAVQLILAALALYGAMSLPPLIGRWGASPAGIALFALWGALAVAGWRTAQTRWRWQTQAPMLIGAVALRIAFGWLSLDRVSPGDAHAYLVIAQQLLDGQGYYFDEPYMGLRTHALFPPGYPLLLAGWGALFGMSTWSLLVLGSLTDVAAAMVIARIGARLDQPIAGRAAALWYLIWPSVLFSAPLAQKESMCTLLALVLAAQWIGWMQGARGWRPVLTLGMTAGWLALTQPGMAMIAALFGIALMGSIGWRGVMRMGMPAAAIAVAVMAPWWLRNWIVFGAFVPLTSAGGLSLWIGNNPAASGAWMPPPSELQGLPELAYTRHAASIAQQWMAAHPLDVAKLTLAKFLRATGVGHFGLVRLAAMYPPISQMLAAMLFPLAQGVHLALLGGASIALRAWRRPGVPVLALLVAACLAQLLLFGVWFEYGERHREFMTPFLLLLAASATSSWQGGRLPRYRPAAA